MRPTPEQQRQMDSRWYDTGYHELGIGFKHDQQPTSKPHPGMCTCPACYEFVFGKDDDLNSDPRHDGLDGHCYPGCPCLDARENEAREQERRDSARTVDGCIAGCLIGLVMWALIIWGAYEWLK